MPAKHSPLERRLLHSLEEARCFNQRRMVILSREDPWTLLPIVVNVFAKFKDDPSILMVIDSSETSSSGAHLLKAFQEECLKKFKGPVKFHQITFHETESVLGTTWDLLILDLMEQLRPNDFGRHIE